MINQGPLPEPEVFNFFDNFWKPPFSRCSVCLVPLPEYYYEEGGQPYCMEHFYEESAHRCGKCADYITGPTMVRDLMWATFNACTVRIVPIACMLDSVYICFVFQTITGKQDPCNNNFLLPQVLDYKSMPDNRRQCIQWTPNQATDCVLIRGVPHFIFWGGFVL